MAIHRITSSIAFYVIAIQALIAVVSVTCMSPHEIIASIAHANPFRKVSVPQAYKRLATTPVYFVSNSGGSPYLQDDVQVIMHIHGIIVFE